MKKILSLCFSALLLSMSAFAQNSITWTVTGVVTTANSSTGSMFTTDLKATSVPADAGTWTAVATRNAYAASSTGAQFGASKGRQFEGTISLSNSIIPVNAIITSVSISAKSNGTYPLVVTVNGTALSEISVSGTAYSEYTAKGSAVGNEIVITSTNPTADKYLNINKIVVTYEEGAAAAVATPTIAIAEEDPYYTGDKLNVTLSCETDGASIYFTTDDSEPSAENGTLYEGAAFEFAPAAKGNFSIKAIAVKDADVSFVATKTVAFKLGANNVAEFETLLAKGEEVRLNFPVTVTFAAQSYIFGQDADGDGICFYAKSANFSATDAENYANGSVIAAGAIGAKNVYYGLTEFDFNSTAAQVKGLEVTAGEPVNPQIVAFEDLSDDYLCKLITIEDVTLTENSLGDYDINGDGTLMLGDKFKLGIIPADIVDKEFDVTGLYVYNSDELDSYALWITKISEGTTVGVDASRIDGGVSIKVAEGAVMVDGADGKVVVFDAMGRVVKSVSANGEATVEMPAGYYIVRTAGVAKAVIVK